MTSNSINDVADQLAKTTVHSTGELSFAGKGFKLDSEKDAQEIIDAIDKCNDLDVLRLEGNTLGVDAAKGIAKALEKHPEFERALWSDMFTGRLKTEIPEALRYLGNGIITAQAKLVELDLSDNAFGPNGMNGLMVLLKSSSCYTLRELRLNNNGLGVTGGKMLAKCLLECYQCGKKAGTPLALRVFVSGRGRLENEGSMALAEAFKAMGSLEEVSMPQNGINHPGITALSEAFAVSPNLRSLNLNDNTFTEVGARSMAQALQKMQKLEVLNFGDCLLRTAGAQAIASAINDGHQHLKEVNLSYNEIELSGGCAIAEAMENKDSLVNLELNGNRFGEEGLDVIKGNMEAINRLEQLGSLSCDELTEDEDEDDDDDDDDSQEEVDDIKQRLNGVAVTPKQEEKIITAADFLQFPSPSKLQQIGSVKGPEAIVNHLGDSIKDIDTVVQTFMKISAVVTDSEDKTKDTACQCADALFKKVFSCEDESIPAAIANTILVNLGLIKSEDKKFKAASNINGPMIVLEHVVRQDYFSQLTRGILQVFISRPHPKLDGCKSRHMVLQALYT